MLQSRYKFVKFLWFKCDGVYPEIGFSEDRLLEIFQVKLLEERKSSADLKFLAKFRNGIIDSPDILQLLNLNAPRTRNVTIFSPFRRACNINNSIQDQYDIFNCSLDEL